MAPTFMNSVLVSLNATRPSTSSNGEPSITELYHSTPEVMLGPWLVGAVLDILIQGVLISQFLYYFRTFGEREGWKSYVRQLVVVVGALSLFKSVQSFIIVYRKFVIGFADFDAALTHETIDLTEPLFTAIIGFIVQGFFAYRCWLLMHRNWYVLGLLAATMVLGLGGAFCLTIMIAENKSAENQADFDTAVIISLAGTLACDLMITIITFVQLTRTRTGLRHIDTIPDRLVRLLWETALPPTICATLNMVLYVTMAEYNFVFITFNMLLAKLYAMALMMTINSRQMRRTPESEKRLLPGNDARESEDKRPMTIRRSFFPPPPPHSPIAKTISVGYSTLPTNLTSHISIRSSWASNPPPFPPPREPPPPVPTTPLSITKKSPSTRVAVPPPLEINLPATPNTLRLATRSILFTTSPQTGSPSTTFSLGSSPISTAPIKSSPLRESVLEKAAMPASYEPGLLLWAAGVEEQQQNAPPSPTPSSPYACSVAFQALTIEAGVRSPSPDSHLPYMVTSPSSAALSSDNFNKDLPNLPRASIA